jgi:hypothetical protein
MIWRQTTTTVFRSDVATTISGIQGALLAIFGSDLLSTVVALVLVLHLLGGLVASIGVRH